MKEKLVALMLLVLLVREADAFATQFIVFIQEITFINFVNFYYVFSYTFWRPIVAVMTVGPAT